MTAHQAVEHSKEEQEMTAEIGIPLAIIGVICFGGGALMTILGARKRDWFGMIVGALTCLCGGGTIGILVAHVVHVAR